MNMTLENMVINIVKQISGMETCTLNTEFIELDMDSTKIIEVLIELEIHFDRDMLDGELNLDTFVKVQDLYDYVFDIINS
jgi:acyl carrier protein